MYLKLFVKTVLEGEHEPTTYLLRVSLRQSGGRDAAGKVLFLAKDVRPVE